MLLWKAKSSFEPSNILLELFTKVKTFTNWESFVSIWFANFVKPVTWDRIMGFISLYSISDSSTFVFVCKGFKFLSVILEGELLGGEAWDDILGCWTGDNWTKFGC